MFEKTVLPNGVTVLTTEDKDSELSTVAAFLNAGNYDENKENNGVAHFLEHMAFKGTETKSALDISREAECLGMDMNAYTSNNVTAYHITGLTEHADVSLDVISDILLNSKLDESDIETERSVILQEKLRSQDNPSSVGWNLFVDLYHGDCPEGRTILGTTESITNMTRDKLVDFISSRYTSSNLVVSATGNISHQQFVDNVSNKFKNVKTAERHRRSVPAYKGGVKVDTSYRFKQATILLGFPIPFGKRSLEAVKFSAAIGAIGQGMSSPLFQEVREKRGLVYGVGAGTAFDDEDGLFYVSAASDNVEECLKVINDVISNADQHTTDLDFKRSVNTSLVSMASLKERPWATLKSNINSYFSFDELNYTQDLIDKFKSINIDDTKGLINTLLMSPPTLAIVGPAPDIDYERLLAR